MTYPNRPLLFGIIILVVTVLSIIFIAAAVDERSGWLYILFSVIFVTFICFHGIQIFWVWVTGWGTRYRLGLPPYVKPPFLVKHFFKRDLFYRERFLGRFYLFCMSIFVISFLLATAREIAERVARIP